MPEPVWNALVIYLGIGCVGSVVACVIWSAMGYKSSLVANVVLVSIILIWPYILFGDVDHLDKAMKKAGKLDEKER